MLFVACEIGINQHIPNDLGSDCDIVAEDIPSLSDTIWHWVKIN